MTVQQLSPGQTYPETPINENNAALGQAFTFTYDKANSTDLDVAITGGVFNGVTLADALLACPDDAESYIVALRADGTLSVIDATDWGDATTYGRVARVTFVSGALTEFADERFSEGGIFDHSTTAAGDVVGPASATDNALALFDGTTGKLIKDSGYTITAAGAALLDDANAAAQRATLGVEKIGIGVFLAGLPTASQLLLRYALPVAVDFADDFASSSRGSASAAATAQTDYDVKKNGSSVGTIRYAAAATTPTFITTGGTVSFAAGDVLSIVAPASPDATLADADFTLMGTRA
jgi:hypothetical protein